MSETKPLENRVDDLELAIQKALAAIGALETRQTEYLSQYDTQTDEINGRLETAEKTIAAIGDALKSVSPANTESIAGAVAEIKSRVNEFYLSVYGPADPNLPFPSDTEPATA